jgi:hypothetical protein
MHKLILNPEVFKYLRRRAASLAGRAWDEKDLPENIKWRYSDNREDVFFGAPLGDGEDVRTNMAQSPING